MRGLADSLDHDLSESKVAWLANELVGIYGSTTLKHINSALNSWRATWDGRIYREPGREDVTFFHDPLPFWCLAKLYIVLHYLGDSFADSSEFSTARAGGMGETNKLQTQSNILQWMVRFRSELDQRVDRLREPPVLKLAKVADINQGD